MKTLVANQKCLVFTLLTFLILSIGIQNVSYGQANTRTVRLFYFLPNDRPYRAEVVEAMKTGILEVQSFYAEQMGTHGHGNMTFNIETDAQGVPIVHRVNGDYKDSHYKDRDRPENEISREFDISSIVQLVVMDISRSSGGRGTGVKQRGQAIIDGRWDWRTAAHELGHAFGLQHDFRDDSYIMSYGSGRSSLSAGAAKYLAVNPYINHSIPLQAGAAPSVQLLSSSQYSYGTTSVPVTVRVRDPDGLQQVTLFVKTPEGINLPTGYNEVVSYHNLSGQTDATVTFNYKGGLPSEGDDDTSLLDQLRHTIYVSAVDKQGNRIDAPPAWTLQPINIKQAKVPVSTRSPRVRDSIYNGVRLFHDRSVSAYDHITDAHLAEIDTLFVNNIELLSSPLQYGDFDGLTNLSRLELRLGSGFSESSLMPAGIFEGLTSLNSLKFLYYTDIYGDDPSLYPLIPLTVGLKKVGEGQFKAIVPTGAPSNMDLPLIVVNGSINGGAESVTIPAGSVESDILTVTRTPGTTAAVIVDLERTVPSPPGSGYVFYKSSFHLEIFSPLAGAPTPVAERTPQVLDAIVAAVPEINHIHHDRDLRYMVNGKFIDKKYNMGHYVSEAHLAAITSLNAPGSSGGDLSLGGNWFSLQGNITELKLGDFDGMTNLTKLRLDGNDLSSFPENIFDNLTNLTALNLADNELSSLPAGLFDNLIDLTTLSLGGNALSSLPAGIFDQLTNLTNLTLYSNQLISLPAGLFDNLTNLTTLNLLDNPLTQLPEGYFDNLTNLTTLFLPPTITPPPLPGTSEVTPVADRTPQVRDAIVAAAGVNSAADVTAGHLAAITELDLQEENITALKQGDFDNLTNLELLGLNGSFSSLPDGIFDHLINLDKFALVSTQLSSLPEGICDNLINLTFFAIANTPLSSLPDSLFDNLTKVSTIYLINTQLSSLPDGIFDNLTNMPYILLSNNQLSSLPSGIFDKATMIVDLSNNQLSSLPDGIFKGIFDEAPDLTGTEIFGVPLGPISEDQLAELGDYTTVNLTGNLVDPLPLTVSLERVANGQFKAVAPAGAPFNLVLPIRVANGSINDGAESITIPVGSVESDTFTVTRTPGTTFSVSVDIETLPGLPDGHSGYTLVKSDELPIVFTELGGRLLLPVSARTPEVRDAIVDAIPGVNSAADVTEAHLAAITSFDVSLGSSVKVGDFAGLTGVTQLSLGTGQLTSLPAGLFNDLTGVTVLGLWTRQLTSLPAGLFNDFSNVTYIEWTDEKLITLPVDAFQGFTNLETFGWFAKGLTSLPAGVLDPLTNLTDLEISAPQLNTLPDGIFDNLTNLTRLELSGSLSTLPDGIFDQLTKLTRLRLTNTELTNLPDGILDRLTALTELGLSDNQLSTLPDGVFAGLPSLTTLILNNNNLTSLPPDIFSELPNLTGLYIRDNQLSTLPDGLFSGLSSLTRLRLDGNTVDPLPLTVSLEKVADGQFKAVAPTGAPFEIVLPITVTNGSITGGATSVTIPVGSVESETLTVTRTSGTTFAVTVDIGTLPQLPTSHQGYALVKSDDLPITVIGGDTVDGSVLTLTVGAGPGAALRGYNQHSAPEWDFGSFSPQSFELNGVSYTMYKLTYSVAGKRLALQTIPHLPGGFALHLDAQQFTSVTALDYNQYTWNNVELDWSDGKTVQIGFIATTPMPPGPPTNLQATPSYEKVTLSWIPPANADSIALPITEYEYRISVDGGNTWDPDWETIGLGRTGHNTLTSCTFGDRNNNSNVDNLIDINLTNGTSYTFEIRARGGDGYSEAARITVIPDGSTPVSQRTPQVRDAIVAAVPGVNSAADVTEAHLAAITHLDIRKKNISALKAGDFSGLSSLGSLILGGNQLHSLPEGVFSGLTALWELHLYENQLTDLPVGVFSGLTTLRTINMGGNNLTSLREDVFAGLSSLTKLWIDVNKLSSLPENVFSGLSSLSNLSLSNNQLSSLPENVFSGLSSLGVLYLGNNQLNSLPSGVFSGLSSLSTLHLFNNQLRELPDGVFSGLPNLASLFMGDNVVAPLPITVSLQKVADGQFKAVARTGAPLDIVLPIRVTHGSINGGATMLTIPAGSVGSDTLTVTSTSEFAVSADIGRLPSLPNNHTGYTLVKSADLPLKVTEGDNPDTFAFTMTVGRLGENSPYPTNRFGFNRPRSPFTPHGSLSRQTFDFKGVTYTVTALYYDIDHNTRFTTREKYLLFETSPLLPRGFELYLDSQQFNSSACDYVPRRQDFGGWNAWRRNVDLNWSIGQTVQVKLVETTPVPPGPPINLQTTTHFKSVTLTWEPPANADPTSLPVEEYQLRVSDDGGTTWDLDWKDIGDSGPGEENRSSVTIDRGSGVYYSFSNGTEYTFEVRAKGGDGGGDAARVTLVMDGITPMYERTPQVRDAIVAAVPGVNSAADVTEAHLAAITSLYLIRKNITTLKAGDFDGLTALTSLDLAENQLSTLPEGIFDDLTALTTLELHDNQFSALPADIFDALTKLRELHLYNNQITTLSADIFDGLSGLGELFLQGNQLTTLPAGIFDKLTVLRNLNLEGNQLSTLPEGIFNKLTELNYLTLADNRLTTLPEGIFDGPSALYDIWLDGNQFTTLPAGIFKMTASFLTLRKLYLEDNAVDPLPLTVSLEKVADGQFKAVAPAGATFDFILQISTANGTINGGTTTLTIPKGSVESDTLTVTRTAGTTAAVSVDIGTLPQLPTSHQGYELVKSTDLPLEVMGATATQVISVNIPDANLRAKIESALGKTSGDPITAAEMATLTTLTAQDASISNLTGLETATNLTTLKLGNNTISNISALSGLTSLTELHLWDNQLSNISALAGLTNLTRLYLWGNTISDISHLSGLTSLRQLRIGENNISNISAVSRLTNLTYLSVKENAISDISAVSGLTNLAELVIGNNTISDITPIQNLTNLEWLDMPNNSISDISAVQNLTQLVELYFQNNAVSDLSPLVTNTGLGTDDELDVRGNPLSYPSIYTHIPALQARNVYVDFDNRVATAPVKISGDTQQGNTGATLAQPFVVEVQDGSSVAFAGVPVTFAVTAGGGSLSATNTTTDVNGRAQSTLTLGNTAGTNTVSVSVTGITQTITFTATATTTNTAPVFTDGTSTTRTIAENTASGVNIGSAVSATDVDNDTLTYSLSGTDASAFDIDTTNGQLQTQAALDYETKSSYTVTVTVSDGDFTDTIAVTISITDVNEVPTASAICEVGDILAPGESCTYPGTDTEFSVLGNGNGQFLFFTSGSSLNIKGTEINGESYTLVAKKLRSGSWEIEEIADSADSTVPETTNTAPVFTDGTSTTRTIAENTTAGINIGTAITATDADNDTLIYTLGGTDAAAFNVDSNTGQLKTRNALDYETKTTYMVTVTVTDGSLTDTITVTISVTDIADTAVTSTLTPVSERTLQVREAILGVVRLNFPTISGYDAITKSHLSGITTLYLNNQNITSLKAGDFDDLIGLEELRLNNNQLTTLPDGIFNNLTSLTDINLYNNQLSSLPAGIFEGLTSLTTLRLGRNVVDPFPLTVSLQKAGEGQFKAVVPTGAPFDIVLPLSVANGSITGGATTLIISHGSVESDFLTVTATPGTTAAVTVDIRTLPSLPRNHYGYALVKSEDIPLAVISGINTTPTFTEGTRTIRTVAENTAAAVNIGTRITATDAENDTLIYSLSGADASTFDIDSSTGQLKTKAALDYETKANYTVTITVSDGSLTDTITVTINITDIEELPTPTAICEVGDILAPGESCTYPGTDTEFSVLGNGNGQFLFFTSGSSLNIKGTEINGESYTLVAKKLRSGSWEIEEIGDSGDQQPVTREQPGDTGGTPTLTASTAAPLTEATLHEGVITLNLSGGTYEQSSFKIRDAVSVSGITGITLDSFGTERISDTEATVKLEFDGNLNTDGTLTITLGADAIADYDGTALTAQIPVTAVSETIAASTLAPLAEATLDESIITLTLSGRKFESSSSKIRGAVSVSGISGVTVRSLDIDRESDTEITVELTFDGDITTDGTLTFTVGAGAIAGYNGPALTAQVSVSASEAPGEIDDQPPETPQDNTPPPATDTRTTFEASTPPGYTRVTLKKTGTVYGIPTKYTSDSDVGTVAYMALAKLTDCNFADAEVDRRSIVYIKRQSLGQLNDFASESVCGKTSRVWSDAWDAVRITHLRFYDETSLPTIKEAAYNSATDQIKLPSVWQPPDEPTVSDGQDPEPSGQPSGNTDGTPTPTTSTTAPLTEATLNGGVITLSLDDQIYELSVFKIRNAMSVAGIPGVTIDSVERVSDMEIAVALTFNGNIDTDATLTFTVDAGAIVDYTGPAFTAQTSVPAVTESIVASTAAPLTEAALDESIITLTLSGRKYERWNSTIRPAVSVSGISGVTVGTFDIDRESDMEITVELTFDGDITTDGTLTFTVGAGAIAGYNGPTLTAQVSVSASTDAPDDTTPATVDTTPVEDDTTPGVCKVGDVLAPGESCTYPGTDTEFSVLGNGSGQFLFFTSGSSLNIKETEINGESYTLVAKKLNSGSWEIEEIGDSGDQQPEIPQQPGDKDPPEQPDNNTGGTPTLSVTTAAPLTEATLHEGVITFNLSDGTFDHSKFTIRDAITLTGISGVTADAFGVDRVSDTEATVELAFDGNMTSDSNLTISLGAGAIKDYDGTALTSQLSVSAVTESITASTASPLTEATLDESVVTLTLSGRKYERFNSTIRPAVSVSGISGVTVGTFDIDRESDTEITVELTFDGDITTDGTLTFTVGADAITGYNGPALTAQVSVSAGTETPVVTDGQTPVTPQQPGDKDPPKQPDNNTGGTPTLSVTTAAPLTEATLHGGIITFNLSDGTFERNKFTIRDAITLTGISGVTADAFGVDRVSDTRVTVELAFAGNMTSDSNLTISLGVDAIKDYDGAALTAQMSVSAVTESVTASTAAPLTEATLDESVVTLTLSGRKYERWNSTIRPAVSVSGISGVTVGTFDIDRESDTEITVELTFDGDITVDGTLTFTVGAGAITGYNGPALTVQVSVSAGTETPVVTDGQTPVTPQQPGDKDPPKQPDNNTGGTPTLSITTAAPLTEATLHEGVITLNLSGGTFERSSFSIRDAITLSGISGVTVDTFGVDRVSDTKVTVELAFDGNMTTDSTLTISVGAGAIKDYNGTALTSQISVRAITESMAASTASPLTEATLDESIVTLTLNGAKYARSIFDIRGAVSVSGISGVTKPWSQPDRKSDTEVTVELEFDGTDFDTTSTLTFTVEADAIAGYNGPALTTQISVSAVTESVVASTPAPLKEATLDGSVVTLTLSGAKYSGSIWDIRGGVTVSGITGVTIPWNQPDRKSDTQITIELEFDGNMNTDGTLTFTVGANAIENYSGSALTTQVTVTADRENVLLANFPNPFNPETWIPYQLAKPTDVTITIYALNGQVVRTLALGHQVTGMYQSRSRAAYWDGKNAFGEKVASGLYFYTLTAGDFTATRKMLIRK